MMRVASRAALLALLWSAASGTAWEATWDEVGDAGDHLQPQVTEGVGNLTELHGDIGGPNVRPPCCLDELDAFLFRYGGGAGPVTFTVDYDLPPGPLQLIGFRLFDEQGTFLVDGLDGAPAGRYILEVVLIAGQDPPYTVGLFGPEGPGGFQFAVPEPNTRALVSGGLLLVAARRRWRREV